MPPVSGFKIDDRAIELFNDMKLGSKKTRYFTMKIYKDEGRIRVEDVYMKTDSQQEDYEQMVALLSQDNCLFVFLDMKIPTKTGSEKEQIFVISWNPDSSTINQKTLYSSTKTSLVSAIKATEGTKIIQANDFDDVDYKTLMSSVKK